MKYTNSLQDNLSKVVDELFESTKLHLLGPNYAKSFVFSYTNFDPATTIQSIYVNSAMNHSTTGKIDNNMITKVANNAESYIDKLKESVNADITRLASDAMSTINLQSKVRNISTREFMATDSGQKVINDLFSKLDEIKKTTTNNLARIVNTETMSAANYGAVDGIIEAAKSIGISDPIIFKITYDHPTRCENCERLHLLDDKITPRVYKLSEVAASTNFKNPVISIGSPHPSCYCVLTFLSPGFGFKSGKITFIGNNENGIPWNEWEYQRNGNGWVK